MAIAQFYKPGNVPVKWPVNGFGTEGDAYSNVWIYPDNISNDVGDWFVDPDNPSPSGSGGAVFDEYGNLIDPGGLAVTANFIDKCRFDEGGDLSVFAQSNKINDNPNTYLIKAGSVPPKDDMQHATASFTWGDPDLGPYYPYPNYDETTYAAMGAEEDVWCLFAADRWQVNGAAYVDFEFNQNTIMYDEITGIVTSNAPEFDDDGDPTGGRTPGDILITFEFTQGGAVGDVWVDKWLKDGIGTPYFWHTQDITQAPYTDALFAVYNNAETHVPWPIYDQDPAPDGHWVYAVNQFVEGAINLSQSMLSGQGPCASIATVWARTKSSHEYQAELKDLAGLMTIDIPRPEPIAYCPDPVSLDPCTSATDAETAYDAWRTGFSYESGIEPVNEAFDPELPEDLPEGFECGGEISVVYTATDLCDQISSCSSTFAVEAAPELSVWCPEPVVISHYTEPTVLAETFKDWLEGFGHSGGCNASHDPLEYSAPDVCGGEVSFTFTVTDDCDQSVECSSYFVVDLSIDPTVECPEDPQLAACTSQEDIQAAWDEWREGFVANSECPYETNIDELPETAPDAHCGIDYLFTYVLMDICDNSASCPATFTVAPAPAVVFNCATAKTEGPCQTQEAINASFAAWLLTTTASGGCNGVLTRSPVSPVAPPRCGGATQVVWTYTTDCASPYTCTRTFTVTPAPPVVFTCATNLTVDACLTQDDVDDAFADWLLTTTASGGCNGVLIRDPLNPTAPSHCGGYRDVTWTYTTSCEPPRTCTRRFTVPDAPELSVWCPEPVVITSYTDPVVLAGLFEDWLDGFGHSGGCNPSHDPLNYSAPDDCGGEVSFTFTVSDDCGQSGECSSYFVVFLVLDPTVMCPEDPYLPACTPQEDVEAAWDLWVSGFIVNSTCPYSDNLDELPELPADAHCGMDLLFTFEAVDVCSNPASCVATFTVAPPEPLVIHCPDPVVMPICPPTEQIVAEYDAWKAGFTKSGDCNLVDNMDQFPPLVIGSDHSVNLSFTYIVTGDCDGGQCSSTFIVPPCNPMCETAYGRLETGTSVCFIEDGFSNWGWTNLIPVPGEYILPLYAGAGQCIIANGELVGHAVVTYTAGGVVTVQYVMDDGFSVSQAHVNVACLKYPKIGKKFTTAPGQYTFVAEGLYMQYGLTVSFTGVYGPFWLIIHGQSCEVQGTGTMTFGPYALNINCNVASKESIVESPAKNPGNDIDMSIRPNPFIVATDIEFTVPWSERVVVEVYNSIGTKVATLFDANAEAGQRYTVRFSIPDQSGQGMYLCVVRSAKGYKVKPVMQIR